MAPGPAAIRPRSPRCGGPLNLRRAYVPCKLPAPSAADGGRAAGPHFGGMPETLERLHVPGFKAHVAMPQLLALSPYCLLPNNLCPAARQDQCRLLL